MRVLLCLLASLWATTVAAEGIVWQDLSLDAALKEAAQKKTPVFIDVFAEWCGPCHALDRKVFNQETVAAALDGVIALRIDAESPAGVKLVERYHVVGYPTMLFIGPDGAEVDRIFGFVEAEAFIKTIQDYKNGRGTLAADAAKLDAHPEDLELLASVTRRYAIRGDAERAESGLEQVLAADPRNAKGLAAAGLYAQARYLHLRGAKDTARAVRVFEMLRARFPKSKEAKRALMGIATAQLLAKKPAAVQAALDLRLKEAEPGDHAANSVAWFCFKKDYRPKWAIAVAKKALKKAPKDAGLWDTLAELQFKQGDTAGAVTSINRAIASDPDEAYYPKQLKKFSTKP